jgi:cob(I)alamin adenosyltransferase
MPSFATYSGDDGTTGILGKERVPKFDMRMEALGTLDEAAAVIGLARSQCQAEKSANILQEVQRHLYVLMSEIATTEETSGHFNQIDHGKVAWLEEQIEMLKKTIEIPQDFILPGDSFPAALLDHARTVVRRAERHVAKIVHEHKVNNPEIIPYLNRLSSLCFILELYENTAAGFKQPTLAKS